MHFFILTAFQILFLPFYLTFQSNVDLFNNLLVYESFQAQKDSSNSSDRQTSHHRARFVWGITLFEKEMFHFRLSHSSEKFNFVRNKNLALFCSCLLLFYFLFIFNLRSQFLLPLKQNDQYHRGNNLKPKLVCMRFLQRHGKLFKHFVNSTTS